MAVASTIQVVMPAMGESVTEVTILEWHKQEGDTVSAEETLVEVSTDKVDAEVPAPAAGTIVKIHAAEGDTVNVGDVLAEISSNGAAAPQSQEAPPQPTPSGEGNGSAAATEAPAPAETQTIDIVTPGAGESVTEGTILEWHAKVGDPIERDATLVEISTDKVDVELPAPESGTITEILAEEGETVGVGQVIARMAVGVGASAPTGASA